MRHKKLKLSAVLLLGLGLTGLQAQESVPATGGNASGSGGSASYSVGQLVYTTNTGSNGSSAQGVQQPYEISVVTKIKKDDEIKLLFSANPNPTNGKLLLVYEDNNKLRDELISFKLIDINGVLIKNEIIYDTQTNIDMSNLSRAIYFLQIIKNKEVIKSFKIIKN